MYRRVLKPGMHVSAKYHQDGEMYDAEVVHVATNNVLVKFLEYDVQVLNVGLSPMRCILQLYGVLRDDSTVLITNSPVPFEQEEVAFDDVRMSDGSEIKDAEEPNHLQAVQVHAIAF